MKHHAYGNPAAEVAQQRHAQQVCMLYLGLDHRAQISSVNDAIASDAHLELGPFACSAVNYDALEAGLKQR